MSTDLDLTRGSDIDDLLLDLRRRLGADLTGNFATMVAALLALDSHYGLRHADDYLLVDPGIAQYLLLSYVIVDDGELVQAIDTGERKAIYRLQTGRPFLVRFSSPWGEQANADIPDALRHTSLRMRVMTDREAGQTKVSACTVRPDGTVILLPTCVES